MRQKNIILIGYRGTGKTSVGKKISATLKMPFYDTDDLVKKNVSRTIAQIVSESGWGMFRELEKNVILGLSTVQGCVISSGGGAVMDRENAASLGKNGIFVWLTADIQSIFARLNKDSQSKPQRPGHSESMKTGAANEIAAVLAQREPVYRRLADFSVDTSVLGIDQIAGLICQWIKGEISCPEAR